MTKALNLLRLLERLAIATYMIIQSCNRRRAFKPSRFPLYCNSFFSLLFSFLLSFLLFSFYSLFILVFFYANTKETTRRGLTLSCKNGTGDLKSRCFAPLLLPFSSECLRNQSYPLVSKVILGNVSQKCVRR